MTSPPHLVRVRPCMYMRIRICLRTPYPTVVSCLLGRGRLVKTGEGLLVALKVGGVQVKAGDGRLALKRKALHGGKVGVELSAGVLKLVLAALLDSDGRLTSLPHFGGGGLVDLVHGVGSGGSSEERHSSDQEGLAVDGLSVEADSRLLLLNRVHRSKGGSDGEDGEESKEDLHGDDDDIVEYSVLRMNVDDEVRREELCKDTVNHRHSRCSNSNVNNSSSNSNSVCVRERVTPASTVSKASDARIHRVIDAFLVSWLDTVNQRHSANHSHTTKQSAPIPIESKKAAA